MSEKQTVKFGDICREVKLTTKDPIADGYERYIGLEHLDSGSLKIKRWGIIEEDNPSFTRVFKKGHILFGKRRPYLKKAAIAEFDGICSGDIIVMEPKESFAFPKLIPFITQSDLFWNWAIKNSSGSLSPRTKFQYLKEFILALPENGMIEAASNLLLKLEETALKNGAVIESCEKLKEVLIEQRLWKRLNKDENFRLKDVAFVEPGYAFKSKDSTEKGIRWLKIANVSFDFVDWSEKSFLPNDFSDKYQKFLLKPGEVVLAMTRPVLNDKLKIAAMSEDDCPAILNQRVTRVRSKENYYTNEQITILMKSKRVVRAINTAILGTDPPNISGKEIERLPLPKLTMEEINEVFIRIAEVEKTIKNAQNEQSQVLKISRQVINDLIGE